MPIVWTKNFPKHRKVVGYLRLILARHRYHNHIALIRENLCRFKIKVVPGYKHYFRTWKDKYKGKRCFVIGNGPSLKKMNLSYLKNEITIGANGIYKSFSKWGFHTTYLIFEDIEQTELRGHEISKIKGPIKLAGIHNAYAFKSDKNTYFMHCRHLDDFILEELFPQFSMDFPYIVHLGGTVTFIALQLAYHLGCDPVYLIGVDHDYGELPKIFPPGKILITEENINLIKGIHFDDNYYSIGDQIGVPNIKIQEDAYIKANKVFMENGKMIYNAGFDSKLDIFDRVRFESLFKDTSNIKDQ